jgi:hypothetical protein
MSKSKLAAVAVAAGLLLIGFELGRYMAFSGFEQGQSVMSSSGPPSRPRPRTPAYPGPRPRAEFKTPQTPAAAAPLGSAEPRAAILDVLRERDAFARASRLSTLLPALGPEAVPQVRATLENLATDRSGVEIALLVRFWAIHAPKDAVTWALLKSPTGYRSGAIGAAFEPWAKVDPEAAGKRIQTMSLLPDAKLDAAEIAVVRGWFESGLPGLEDYIRDLGMGVPQQRALGVFARNAIQRDGPEAIARWAESIPDEDETFKLDAFRQLGTQLAMIDPAAARAWCDAHCEGPFGTTLRQLIAQRWAAQDGRAAMQWLSTAPAGKERDWAVKGAFRGWFRSDRESLSSWVAAMGLDGVEPWFQPALEGYAIWVGATDPSEGMKWAAVITDDVDRERTFVTIARRWHLLDESAADAWIEQSPLSEEARERARTPMKLVTREAREARERSPDTPSPTP